MSSSPRPKVRRRPRRSLPLRAPARGSGLAGWSLRGRLIAGVLALLAVVCVGIGAVATLAVRQSLIAQLDESLDAAAKRTEAPLHFGGGLAGPPLGGAFPLGQGIGTISYLTEPGGTVTAQVLTEDGPEALTERQRAALASVPTDGQAVSTTVDGLGDYRVTARTIKGYTVVTALPMAAVQETVWQLVLIEAAVAGSALILAAVAGPLIVGGALSPLRRVTATARRVTQLPLAQGDVDLTVRVPPHQTDPRTEVGQLGAAFNRMLGHVGDALAARHASELRVRQFVADASHELRTPLAAIRGYAEMTRRAPADVTIHALARIEAESRRMSLLVDDLLLLARLDSGRPLEREPVQLSQLVVDAVGDAHAAGPDHAWRLVLPDAPVTVTGDHARLQQVIGNLLTNARVHTPAGTTVTTSLAVCEGEAALAVTDNGPGIAAELRGEIFERFVRGDASRSRAHGSTGLGLAIVAAVVAAHAGRVQVDSDGSSGTSFAVHLPGAVLGE
jgi:two-component system, OmpR family, sensor kinase